MEQAERELAEACKKIDRLTWALGAAAITFGMSALFLALNLMW